MPFAVIFAMDGVLIDTNEYIWGTFKEVMQENNVALHDHEMVHYRGKSWKDVLHQWKVAHGFEISLPAFAQRIAEKELAAFDASKHLIPGVKEFLSLLQSHHIPMAVGTSSHAERAEIMLAKAGILPFFDAIASASDVSRHKPSPDIFLAAAKKLNVTPENCIVFEDAPAGVQAAHAAGMKCVGYLDFRASPGELVAADIVITTYSDISISRLEKLVMR